MAEPSKQHDDLVVVRRILECRLQGRPVRVYLFGSRARGTWGRASDIDVAILPLKPLPPGLLSSIREEMEDAPLLSTVELVDLSQSAGSLRNRVEEEGIRWIG